MSREKVEAKEEAHSELLQGLGLSATRPGATRRPKNARTADNESVPKLP